jgi:hypothetical protein
MADGKLIELEKQRAELNTAIEELTENRRETLETLQTKK